MAISVDASQHQLNHKRLISPNLFFGQALITCGDVLINGQPLSGATQESLWLDMMGMKDGESEFKGHVWINMQSGQILDLTIGLYMLAKHLGGPGFPPPDFKWINYVYRSDRPEPGNYTLEYRPMLFGHRVLKSVLDLPKYLLA